MSNAKKLLERTIKKLKQQAELGNIVIANIEKSISMIDGMETKKLSRGLKREKTSQKKAKSSTNEFANVTLGNMTKITAKRLLSAKNYKEGQRGRAPSKEAIEVAKAFKAKQLEKIIETDGRRRKSKKSTQTSKNSVQKLQKSDKSSTNEFSKVTLDNMSKTIAKRLLNAKNYKEGQRGRAPSKEVIEVADKFTFNQLEKIAGVSSQASRKSKSSKKSVQTSKESKRASDILLKDVTLDNMTTTVAKRLLNAKKYKEGQRGRSPAEDVLETASKFKESQLKKILKDAKSGPISGRSSKRPSIKRSSVEAPTVAQGTQANLDDDFNT